MLRRTTRLSIAVLAAVLTATCACSSGTTGQPAPSSGSASAQTSPAFPSESLPPGVQKDSVLDLNSTKDMTGVVTTVSFGDSPYAAHLPDICTLIPDSAMKQLGVDSKKRGFTGTQLISQACNMQASGITRPRYSITVNAYTNNLQEILDPSTIRVFSRDVAVSTRIRATTMRFKAVDATDTTPAGNCGAAWGTFYGSVVVDYEANDPPIDAPCDQAIAAAKVIAPYMPKSPSQMRPAP